MKVKMKIEYLLVIVLILLLLIAHGTKIGQTAKVSGLVVSLTNNVEFEPKIKVQVITWECNKEANETRIGGLGISYNNQVWNLVNHSIPDTLEGCWIELTYKTIDPRRGLFFDIDVKPLKKSKKTL